MTKLTILLDSPLWWPFSFAARGRHSWLLPKATTSLKSQKPIFSAGGRHIFLWPEATSLSKSHVPTEIGTMVTIGIMHLSYPKLWDCYACKSDIYINWTLQSILKLDIVVFLILRNDFFVNNYDLFYLLCLFFKRIDISWWCIVIY